MMEQDLWYRWRTLERSQPRYDLTLPAGRTKPGVVEESRRAVGRFLVRLGIAVAGVGTAQVRSARP